MQHLYKNQHNFPIDFINSNKVGDCEIQPNEIITVIKPSQLTTNHPQLAHNINALKQAQSGPEIKKLKRELRMSVALKASRIFGVKYYTNIYAEFRKTNQIKGFECLTSDHKLIWISHYDLKELEPIAIKEHHNYINNLIEQILIEELNQLTQPPKFGDIQPTTEPDNKRPGMKNRPKDGMDVSQQQKMLWSNNNLSEGIKPFNEEDWRKRKQEEQQKGGYPFSQNLAQDVIVPADKPGEEPKLWVSTSILASHAGYSNSYHDSIETWIFSNIPEIKSQQKYHKSHNLQKALKVHEAIVNNLKQKFNVPVTEAMGIGVGGAALSPSGMVSATSAGAGFKKKDDE